MLDSNIRGLFKKIEYQIANLKGLFSKNEKQMLDNINDFKKDNEEFKDNLEYTLKVHTENKSNPHGVNKNQVGLDQVDNVKQASESDFNDHVDNKDNPHGVSKSQLGLGKVIDVLQASKEDLDTHTSDLENPHQVTKKQIGLDKLKNEEQATLEQFNAHVDDKNLHTTELDQTKWNNGQLVKITKDTGEPKIDLRSNTDNLLQALIGNKSSMSTYYAGGSVIGLPSNRFIRGISYMSDLENGQVSRGWTMAFDSSNTLFTNYYEQSWTGWKRLLTSNDIKTSFVEISLGNGATHGTNKAMCSVVGSALYLKGEVITSLGVVFGSLPISYRPTSTRHVSIPVFGTSGSATLVISNNGNMWIDTQLVSNASNITSYGLDHVIPIGE
ncbi:hypothetical protein ACTHPT_14110 [Bacillus altitudinis]|uniref:hypothetical protein n=1 Tax=Bacillus altitudinis TaxID=293387 RepID=UPI003F7B8B4B